MKAVFLGALGGLLALLAACVYEHHHWYGPAPLPPKDQCRVLIDHLTKATNIYEKDWATFPPSGNKNLAKFLGKEGPDRRPYLPFIREVLDSKGRIIDPWHRPIRYQNSWSQPTTWVPHNRRSFDLYSVGPNGQDELGKGDDLTNWKK